MDRLTSLVVFGQVVDSGGFSAAARRLNLSVTMVSNHIQALEDRLGARLLNRSTRKISLTEIGRAYHARSVQILHDLEEADSIASATNATPRGTLRISTNPNIVRFLSPVIAEFLARHTQVTVDLVGGERMVDMIEDGFDLAIRTSPPPESRLVVRSLTPWRHIVCCAPSYLQAHPAPLHPSDLAQHNCLRYAFYPYGDAWRFDGPDQPVSVHVAGNLVTNSPEMLLHMARAGHGIFFAPDFIVAGDVADGTLVRLLADHRPVEQSICAIYPNRHHLSGKVRLFLDLLVSHFARHRRWLDPL